MGRLPYSGAHGKNNHIEKEELRQRHQYADGKYRSKNRYLYDKIMSFLRKKSAKDALLDNSLAFIQESENEIYEIAGSNYMENCKKEFIDFLVQEDSIWKKQNDVDNWWIATEDLFIRNSLTHEQVFDLNVQNSKLPLVLENDKPAKPLKRPYRRRKNLLPRKAATNESETRCVYRINKHKSMMSTYNKDFKMCDESSCINEERFSSSWNVPDISIKSFGNTDKKVSPEKSSESSSSNDDIFNSSFLLDVTTVPVPVGSCTSNILERPQHNCHSFMHL